MGELKKLGLTALLAASTLAGCHYDRTFYKNSRVSPDTSTESSAYPRFIKGKTTEQGPDIYTCGGLGGTLFINTSAYWREFLGSDYPYIIECSYWKEAVPSIEKSCKNDRPLVIFGHSLGCADALRLTYEAKKLNPNKKVVLGFWDAGYLSDNWDSPFLKLACFGPTIIPDNVSVVLNYHSKGVFRGSNIGKNMCASENTEIVNHELRKAGHCDFNNSEYLSSYLRDIMAALRDTKRKEAVLARN